MLRILLRDGAEKYMPSEITLDRSTIDIDGRPNYPDDGSEPKFVMTGSINGPLLIINKDKLPIATKDEFNKLSRSQVYNLFIDTLEFYLWQPKNGVVQ